MSNTEIPEASCNKELLETAAFRFYVLKVMVYVLMAVSFIILLFGPYIGTKPGISRWYGVFSFIILIVPAILLTIASAGATIGSNACNNAIKKGIVGDINDKKKNYTPFLPSSFTQYV